MPLNSPSQSVLDPARCRASRSLAVILALAAVLAIAACANPDEERAAKGSGNAQTIEQLYGAFRSGDMESILSLMADDVKWIHPGPDTIPFAGTFEGKQGVEQFFAKAIEHLDVLDQQVGDLLVHGDKVAAFGSERMRVKTTGREYRSNWIHVYTLRDGRIVRFEEYIDTAAVAAGFEPASEGPPVSME